MIKFLKTCGEENLQFLLVPARLKKSLDYLDTDGSGELDIDEWEAAINRGLAKRLEQMAEERSRRERAAAKADEEFSADFLSMARQVFDMIDKDQSGFLDKAEVVAAVRADKEVIAFLTNCGNKNLQYLLVPSRLESALAQLDSDRDGEIDANEWEEASPWVVTKLGSRRRTTRTVCGPRRLVSLSCAHWLLATLAGSHTGHRDGPREQARAAPR